MRSQSHYLHALSSFFCSLLLLQTRKLKMQEDKLTRRQGRRQSLARCQNERATQQGHDKSASLFSFCEDRANNRGKKFLLPLLPVLWLSPYTKTNKNTRQTNFSHYVHPSSGFFSPAVALSLQKDIHIYKANQNHSLRSFSVLFSFPLCSVCSYSGGTEHARTHTHTNLAPFSLLFSSLLLLSPLSLSPSLLCFLCLLFFCV